MVAVGIALMVLGLIITSAVTIKTVRDLGRVFEQPLDPNDGGISSFIKKNVRVVIAGVIGTGIFITGLITFIGGLVG